MTEFREESDLLGSRSVPRDAYWGIHTLRACENFPVSGAATPLELIYAYARVKKAACLANRDLGFLTPDSADAVCAACEDIVSGLLDDQFPIDALQGGAGTSTNMNVNEVIANRALYHMGKASGSYECIDPIDHVNLHQSTNDTYPTALKVAAIEGVRSLSAGLARLQGAFQQKEKAFSRILTIGRTEMQPAVPMTLGSIFSGFAQAISRDRWRTAKCEERLRVVNIGGTAVGTGLTAPRRYIFLVIEKLREVTGMGLTRGESGVDQTANADSIVEVSGILDACAVNLRKISNDLRLLHLHEEIRLAPVQAGSSIMPGKVNPVIAEAGITAGLKVSTNHSLISQAVASGTLQISEFLPLCAHALLESIRILTSAADMLAHHVESIEACEKMCGQHADNSPMLVTAFIPLIGYHTAQALLTEYQKGDHAISFRHFLQQKLGQEIVRQTLTPENIMALGYRGKRSFKN
ncbi:MAG: aspartate ammonia-lyase [Chitinivibrionales bacterium]